MALLVAASVRPACVQQQFIPNAPALTYFIPDLSSGLRATAAVAADFNGDGAVDIAVVGTDAVLLGTPSGRFFVRRGRLSSLAATGILTADFNGDHVPDIVVWDRNTFAVLQGRGDGTFDERQSVTQTDLARDFIAAIAAADFDGDGHVDLLVSGADTLTLYSGLRDGTFSRRAVTPLDARVLLTADFLGNGKPAVAAVRSDGLALLRPNGDGTFAVTPLMTFAAGHLYDGAIAAADFNGDGVVDLALAVQDGLRLAFGRGDGTFRDGPFQAVNWQQWHEPAQFVVADLDRDGRSDLIAVQAFALEIFRNIGGAFADPQVVAIPPSAVPFGIKSLALAVFPADIDGDGFPDIIEADSLGFVSILMNGCGSPIIVRASSDAVVSGTPLTLTAYFAGGPVTAPTTFRDSGVIIGTGNGSLTTSLTTPGRHSITAAGSSGVTVPLIINVTAQPPAVTASVSKPRAIFGDAIVLSGTVSLAGKQVALGEVEVVEGTTVVETAVVTGGAYAAAVKPGAGAHQLSVRFTGGAEAPASEPSPPLTLTVDPAPTSMVVVPSNVSPCFGVAARPRLNAFSVLVNAPFSSPTGTVMVSIPELGVQAQLRLDLGYTFYNFERIVSAGRYAMTVQYSGDANHQASRLDTFLIVPPCRHRAVGR